MVSEMLISNINQCSLNCANNGYCAVNPITSPSYNLLDGKLREVCICPKGFTGLSCQQRIGTMDKCQTYGDQQICLNGGLCRLVLSEGNLSSQLLSGYGLHEKNEWVCDCLEADGVSAFAGSMCRKPHTEFCNREGNVFCTNGGTCVNYLIGHSWSIQYGTGSDFCLCPKEFTGPHCEFLKRIQEPSDVSVADVSQYDNTHRSSLVKTFLSLFSITTIALLTLKMRKKIRKEKDHYNKNGNIRLGQNHEQFYDHKGDENYIMVDINLT